MIPLYESKRHKNLMFNDLGSGEMVQANQHLIVDDKRAMILDPGGHKVYSRLFSQVAGLAPDLEYIFFSHQDPDIIAAANGWLMVTEAHAYLSELWMRFIPHFGVDRLVIDRIRPIPDEGMKLTLGETELEVLPAHFLHSPGNFQVYDPEAKILYSGDLGASLGCDYPVVEDFEDHIQYMIGFHQRYIPSGKALGFWARMVAPLDIDILAPQHGAVFKGPEMVARFIQWAGTLECGLDRMEDGFVLPG